MTRIHPMFASGAMAVAPTQFRPQQPIHEPDPNAIPGIARQNQSIGHQLAQATFPAGPKPLEPGHVAQTRFSPYQDIQKPGNPFAQVDANLKNPSMKHIAGHPPMMPGYGGKMMPVAQKFSFNA